MRSRRAATLLAGVSLALPGAALAQAPGGQGSQPPSPGRGAAPLSNSAPSAASSSPASSSPRAAPPGARRLPSTGADAGLLALLGFGLLLTGSGLRLRLREPDACPE